MLIQKLVKVENVGRFAKLASTGNVTFQKVTLLYGENGHGKTTVAGILRSLATGDAAYLAERATLGAASDQLVEVLLGGSAMARFTKGAWSKTVPEIEIFDATFVSQNVHAGDSVDADQRKNLYDVVVGAAGVALRNRIDELDGKNRKEASAIKDVEAQLGRHIQAPFAINDFLALTAEEGIEEKIRAATTRLNALRNSKAILSRPKLQALRLPESPRHIADLIATRVEQVAQSAIERVRTHIQMHLGPAGENWVRQGLQFSHADACPFCGQGAGNSDLLSLYPAYFSKAYEEKVIELQRGANRLDQTLGEAALAEVRQTVMENAAAIQTWKDLADLEDAATSIETLEKAWRHVFEIVRAQLRIKLANPTQVPEGHAIVEAALRDFEEATATCKRQNAKISEANEQIDDLKKSATASDEKEVEAELRTLRNSQIRQQPEVKILCQTLLDHRNERARLTDEKERAREQLEKQAGQVLTDYQDAINRYLDRFGASFKMTGTKPDFPGGKASSVYQIEINGQAVDLGDSRTKTGTVCFRTALSTGDRSTLALAFFLARLDRDQNLGSKVIIFDDPMSSFDCFRAACTQQELSRLASKADQLFVMSHDAGFLKSIYDEDPTAKTLHIARRSGSHELEVWDIEEHCKSQAHRDYFMLKSFLSAGVPKGTDLASIARRIRPYVEDYVRHKYPGDFSGGAMLGQCIEAIRSASSTDGAGAFKPKLAELEDINDFGKRFMHSDGQPAGQVSEQELQTFAKRAIALVQGP